MGKAILVEPDIDHGKKLVQELDSHGFPVRAALWLLDTNAEEWRLLLATGIVDRRGPRAAYQWLQEIQNEQPEEDRISLSNISLVGQNDELVRVIRTAIRTSPTDVAGIRFTRNTINNVLIEDAFIYRMS